MYAANFICTSTYLSGKIFTISFMWPPMMDLEPGEDCSREINYSLQQQIPAANPAHPITTHHTPSQPITPHHNPAQPVITHYSPSSRMTTFPAHDN